jgi:uncharacterized membrane protein YfhO
MRFIDTRSRDEVFKKPDFLSVLKTEEDPYFRIYDESGQLDQNLAYGNNLFLINGYDPTYLKQYQQFFLKSQYGDINETYWWKQRGEIKDLDILRILNVRYIITTRSLNFTGIECIDKNSPLIYRLNFTYPRAYLIPVSEYYNIKPNKIFPAKILHYSPNNLLIYTNNSEDTFLVTSEIYYPGWEARENSTKIEITRYQGIFRSVRLKPGEHIISFSYFPKVIPFHG